MKTITLVDKAGNPMHSRLVTNKIAAAGFAKIAGDRIIAVYGPGASLPNDLRRIAPITNGVVRIPA